MLGLMVLHLQMLLLDSGKLVRILLTEISFPEVSEDEISETEGMYIY